MYIYTIPCIQLVVRDRQLMFLNSEGLRPRFRLKERQKVLCEAKPSRRATCFTGIFVDDRSFTASLIRFSSIMQ